MNYFGMSYEEVLDSPMQRLQMLAKGIPKYNNDEKEINKPQGILDFVKKNNLLRKK